MARALRRAFAIALALIAVVALAHIALNVWFIAQARRTAAMVVGGSPSCIQIPGGVSGYYPIRALLDLYRSAPVFSSPRYYALLVVGPERFRRVYNWSYRRQYWSPVPGPRQSEFTINCLTRENYLEGLHWVASAGAATQSADRIFRMGENSFLIPARFHPRTDGGTYLSIDAPAPSFDPTTSDPAAPDSPKRVHVPTNLQFTGREWLQSLAKSNADALDIASLRSTDVSVPRSFLQKDATGNVETLIYCPTSQTGQPPTYCQHRFYADGAMWTFNQSVSDLPKWQELQSAFKSRIAEFRAAAGRCDADPKTCSAD